MTLIRVVSAALALLGSLIVFYVLLQADLVESGEAESQDAERNAEPEHRRAA